LDGGRDVWLLTARQVADRLGVCTATVYKLAARRELAFVRISGAVRIAPADLDAFLASSRKGGRP